MRAFIAIGLPPAISSSLAGIQQKLRAGCDCPAKWTTPDGMHLTLAFLGNIVDNRVAAITAAMAQACESVSPFRLQLSGAGAFPGLQRPDIIWIGLSGDTGPLTQLHQKLWQNLSPLGFTPEKRSFHAHLTLARFRESAAYPQRRAVMEALSHAARSVAPVFSVSELSLMQSKLSPAGASYSRLAHCRLKQA